MEETKEKEGVGDDVERIHEYMLKGIWVYAGGGVGLVLRGGLYGCKY